MKILLPIDGSDAAAEAVEFVRSLANSNPVDAIVMMVSYDPAQYSRQPWVPEWTEQEHSRTQTILSKAKDSLDADCQSVSVVHGSGSAVPNILGQAQKLEVDLIVLGAKGHSAIRRVLLGSISDNIATRAKCSVVVVRPTESKTHEPNRIVLGFDKSVASREAVAELMEWNLHHDASVDVVSVVQNPYIFFGEGYMDAPITVTPEQIRTVRESAERKASQIAEHFPHTESHSPVADHVGEAIVQAAEKGKADLVVVGDSGHGLLGDLLLGSTSKYVLRHAPCTVWISRHHWKSTEAKPEASHAIVTG